MSHPSPQEQRKLSRHPVEAVVRVFDANRGVCIGQLANVHEQGLMLMGKEPLQTDHLYQLELHLADNTVIPLGVDCLWVRQSDEDPICWAGCQIIDLSDQAEQQLQALVPQLGS